MLYSIVVSLWYKFRNSGLHTPQKWTRTNNNTRLFAIPPWGVFFFFPFRPLVTFHYAPTSALAVALRQTRMKTKRHKDRLPIPRQRGTSNARGPISSTLGHHKYPLPFRPGWGAQFSVPDLPHKNFCNRWFQSLPLDYLYIAFDITVNKQKK